MVVTASPALAAERKPAPPRDPAVGENLYLLGRPTLSQFLRYARSHAVHSPSKATLNEQWHAARAIIRELERDEAGIADAPPMTKLGPEYQPLLLEFFKDPLVRHGFNTVPTNVVLVELDRLVVYQKHVDLWFAQGLERQLGPAPSREQVFRTCLPHDHPKPPVRWSRQHGGSYVFVSPSNDLRFLGPMPLEPRHIRDYPPPGNLVGVVGVAIGFGANFLNALYAENRLILNNGTHRAYVLRKLGVTHAPCVVQHVSTRDELEVLGTPAVRRDPDAYLAHPRPSLLKDYFDPRLYTVIPVYRRLRQLTVRFEVDENFVPAL